jgi:hypothetical protein
VSVAEGEGFVSSQLAPIKPYVPFQSLKSPKTLKTRVSGTRQVQQNPVQRVVVADDGRSGRRFIVNPLRRFG